MPIRLPHIRPGQVVGLLGGSFDPPHGGHVALSKVALQHFALDHLFWLVSPGNPLKPHAPAMLSRRVARSRSLLRHPRVHVSAIEAELKTRFTADTLRVLQKNHPGVRFVWLMGADNLTHFHHWREWRRIIETVPMGVLARPGDRISARTSAVAQIYRHALLKPNESRGLGKKPAPAWCFLNMPMVDLSSTKLRANGEWTASNSKSETILT
ncbi:nicotinate-nucleotide adenylyltransferase [Epibacterium ulvae]|uniref:Probable nicotinate-nucleotide adenylyltransferase n=1 Tax=Epibacterium ulvae TaxID=1156985 RepID=A0A1G5R1E7_9RHOB|nr:nicotinate-nucleotide adenylyltransferase [Epibacterium ulvae]SCZ67766.1 nicotinate-nucleotide adenylyltransferase [Epibacterium ulvae]